MLRRSVLDLPCMPCMYVVEQEADREEKKEGKNMERGGEVFPSSFQLQCCFLGSGEDSFDG